MSKKRKPDDNQLGDGPIEEKHRETMLAIAGTLDELFNGKERPKKIGFIVMVFPFGDDEGRTNYVSNANRQEVITLLKEQIARFEGRYHDHGKR